MRLSGKPRGLVSVRRYLHYAVFTRSGTRHYSKRRYATNLIPAGKGREVYGDYKGGNGNGNGRNTLNYA